MTDRPEASPWLKAYGTFCISALLACSPQVFAQETDDEEEEEEVRATEEVVVTGSRIKRNTFTSVSPLQIISGQVSRNIGSIDPTTLLQDSTAAAGQQVDLTYQGFVLDNGPGATEIDLRGLGGNRSLILINGRRAAPAGVEGVPVSPDANMIPSSLVSQYEVLLDGASSVYGSDALAGVVNVVLRKDFDGLELESYTTVPEYDNGIVNTVSAAWGMNGDRGFVGFGAEYTDRESVARGDRPWSEGCESDVEIDRDGNIYTSMRLYNVQYGMKETECYISFGAQRIFGSSGLFGSLYFTPNTSNVGIPFFSEATLGGLVLDTNQDGQIDVDFTDYFRTSETNTEDLFPESTRTNLMAFGEYTFDGDMNITPYFELTYNQRETSAFNAGSVVQITPPADNPFNPCNPNGIGPDGNGGVDCGVAYNAVLDDPAFVEPFRDLNEALCARFGFTRAQCTPSLFGLRLPGDGTVGALPFEAQVSIRGDRTDVVSDVDQLRTVVGVRGDLPMIDFGDVTNWSFDVALVHSDGTGTSSRPGINGDRLDYSLETSRIENGQVVCGDATGGPCVPVNLYDPSLYQTILSNEFGSQAERDFLFSDRTFETTYEQTYISAFATGDLIGVPAGAISAAIGYEYRNDTIDSIPNDVARDGLLYGYFRDLGAVGEKDTEEWFAEVEIPLLANARAAKELNVNVSTRHTKDEFYGGAWTYSGKLGWRPVDNLLIRGTVGTSYRAPNLRENFLQGQSGFLTLGDPCVPPDEAIQNLPVTGVTYVAADDTRDQVVLDNCIAQGVDPTTLGVSGTGFTSNAYSMEIFRGVGSTTIDEEKSESWTAGFSWDVEFLDSVGVFEDMDISLGATYYEIDIIDEIIQQSASGSIFNCYNDAELDSVFCGNISREDGGTGLIDEVSQAFLNRDSLTARGVDVNIAIDWPVEMFGRPVDFAADINLNRKLELSSAITNTFTGEIEGDSNLGQFGVPEWEGNGTFRADFGDWRITWNTRYLASVEADPDSQALYPFSPFGNNRTTCPDDAECRPVMFADNYFRHDMSVYYYGDVWTIGVGARNVTNEAPPKIDGRGVFANFNTPLGAGYDLNGRTFFVNIAAAFDNLTF